MSDGKVMLVLGRLWRSPLLTAAMLAAYALWLGSGLWIGALEFRDKDKIVPVRLNYSAKQREWIDLEGEATLYTLRKERRACNLVNEAQLRIRRTYGRHTALHLLLATDNVVPSALLTVIDESTGERHVIDDLRPYRTEAWIPLAGVEVRLRIVPSTRELRYSIRELHIDDAAADAGFRVLPQWKLIHESETHRIEQGSGFHDLGHESLWMRQIGFLRITPRIPNARRLSLVYRKMLDSYSEPIVWMDRRRAPSDRLGWSRGDRGITSLEVASEITAPAIIGLELTEPVRSPFELGFNEDPRRLSYEIMVESCSIAARG